MSRIFIAVRFQPPEALLHARAALEKVGPPVRVLPVEKLHITLRFLGAVDEAIHPLLVEAIDQAAAVCPRFAMSFRGVGAFPKPQRPSVIWAGGSRDEPLHRAVATLTPLLASLDLPVETKPWVNHVTLARVKSKPPAALQHWFERFGDAPLGEVDVAAIDLMASELSPRGATYTVLESVALPIADQ